MDQLAPHTTAPTTPIHTVEEGVVAATGELVEDPQRPVMPQLFKESSMEAHAAREGSERFEELFLYVGTLLHDIERGDGSNYWCPQWWLHPEAVLRFTALQKSMTKAKEDLSSWILHDLSPHLDYLFSKDGPFTACTNNRHDYKTGKDHYAPSRRQERWDTLVSPQRNQS